MQRAMGISQTFLIILTIFTLSPYGHADDDSSGAEMLKKFNAGDWNAFSEKPAQSPPQAKVPTPSPASPVLHPTARASEHTVYKPSTASLAGVFPVQPFQGASLTCERSGENQCSQENMKLKDVEPNYFSSIFDPKERQKQFIDWLQPLALYIQATTGMPASVIIAQAGLESGWGTSSQFKNNNALFGHSCWKPGTQVHGTINFGGMSRDYTGYCGTPRPEGGYYLAFPNREESVLAYASNLMNSGLYKDLDRTLAQAHGAIPPQVASSSSVLSCLGSYAADGGYEQKLSNTIGACGLNSLDSNSCQMCLYAQNSGSSGSDSSGAAQ